MVRLVDDELCGKGRIQTPSHGIEKISRNRHSRDHILVNKSLMFKFFPLICCERKPTTSSCTTHHGSQDNFFFF